MPLSRVIFLCVLWVLPCAAGVNAGVDSDKVPFTPWGAAYSLIAEGDYARLYVKVMNQSQKADFAVFHELASKAQPYFCSLKLGFVDTGRRLKELLLEDKALFKSYMNYRNTGSRGKLNELLSDFDFSEKSLKALSDFAVEERFTPASLQALLVLADLFMQKGQLFVSHIYAQAAYQESLGINEGITKESLVFLVHLYSVLDFSKVGLPFVNLNRAIEAIGNRKDWKVRYKGKSLKIEEYLEANLPATKAESRGYLVSPKKSELADALRFFTPFPNAYFNPFEIAIMSRSDQEEMVRRCKGAPARFTRVLDQLFVSDSTYYHDLAMKDFKTVNAYTKLSADPLFSPEYLLAAEPVPIVLKGSEQVLEALVEKNLNVSSFPLLLKRLEESEHKVYTDWFFERLSDGRFKVDEMYCGWGFEVFQRGGNPYSTYKRNLKGVLDQDFYLDFVAPCLKADLPALKDQVFINHLVSESFDLLGKKIDDPENFVIAEALDKVSSGYSFRYAASVGASKAFGQTPVAGAADQKIKYLNRFLAEFDSTSDVRHLNFLRRQLDTFMNDSSLVLSFPKISRETLNKLMLELSLYDEYWRRDGRFRFFALQMENHFANKLGDTRLYEDLLMVFYEVYWVDVNPDFLKKFASSFSSNPKKAKAIYYKIKKIHEANIDKAEYYSKKRYVDLGQVMTIINTRMINLRIIKEQADRKK